MTSFAVTLLSGGLDSTTVTAYAKPRCDRLTAITFQYGQAHSREVASASEVARLLGVAHKLIDISFLGDVAWYSALTNPEAFPAPAGREPEEMGASIPITYVPLRNTTFVALAAAYLESEALHAVEVEGVAPGDVSAAVYMAPNVLDYSGYPDCRPEFFARMSETIRYGSKLGAEYGIDVRIETPIIEMSKADIVRMAVGLGAPLERTWSCYAGGERPCGACDSCVLRARGFREAGVADPALRERC